MPGARPGRTRARRAALGVAVILLGLYAALLAWMSEAMVSPPRPTVSASARPVLGVVLRDVDGVTVVERVVEPARSSGLRPGDRIRVVDGRPVTRAADVAEAVGSKVAGEPVRVEAIRAGADGVATPVWVDVPVDVRIVSPSDAGLTYQDVAFTDSDGRILRGWYVPAPVGAAPAPGVVYGHGNGGDRRQWLPVAWAVHRAGFGQLLFDFAGRGESEGDRITLGPREADGIGSAIDALASRPEIDGGRVVVVGRSMGAAAAILAADGDPRVRGLILDSPFATLREVVDDNLRARGLPPGLVRGPLFALVAIRARFEPDEVRPVDVVARLDVPILLFHGTDDRLVPFRHAERIRDAGGDRLRFEPWDGLDHNAPRPADLDDRVAAFALEVTR